MANIIECDTYLLTLILMEYCVMICLSWQITHMISH